MVGDLVPSLLFLACSIGTGLTMWLMMHGDQQQATGSAPTPAGQAAAPVPEADAPATLSPASGPVSNGRAAAPFKPTSSLVLSLRRGLGGLCLNWKVVGGLAAVGLGIWVVAPGLVWAALPLLLLAACPLSMLLTMRGMTSGQCQVAAVGRDGDERIAALKAQLDSVQAQQEAIVRQLAELEAAKRPTSDVSPAGSKERVARGGREQLAEY